MGQAFVIAVLGVALVLFVWGRWRYDVVALGALLALAGVLLICLVGWRWLPRRKGEASRDELFEVDDYLSEVRVPEDSRWVGRSLSGLGQSLAGQIVVVGIARGDREITAPSGQQPLRAEDVLLVEAEPEDLRELVDREGLEPAGTRELKDRLLTSGDEVQIVEVVVQPDSRLAGSTARELELRAGHGVNPLGVARGLEVSPDPFLMAAAVPMILVVWPL